MCKIKKYGKAWSTPTIGGLVGLDGIRSEGRHGISVCVVAFFAHLLCFRLVSTQNIYFVFGKCGFLARDALKKEPDFGHSTLRDAS